MKFLKLTYVAITLLLVVNCSKDDDESNSTDTGSSVINNNESEDQDIPLNVLDQGLSIAGAEKISAALPEPNGSTSFDIENSQSGFLNAGVQFELQVPSNYAGAYIQIQSTDGSQKSGSYFNVPADNFFSFKEKNNKGLKFISQSIPENSSNISTEEIRIDFNDSVPAGKFCYTICVYDTENNISLPQTVCVEVEAWGGNNEIVGSWKFTKQEESINGGPISTVNLNEKDCEDPFSETITCENGNTLSFTNEYCDTTTNLVLNINADGTQSIISEFIDESFDFTNSRLQCTEVLRIEDIKFESSGNWAYDEEERIITFIEFENTETVNGVVDSEVVEDFGFEIELLSVNATSLIVQVTETYTDFNSSPEASEIKTLTTKFFFEK